MPDLVPVEHDPFGDAPYALPVDHVPEFGDAPVRRAGSIGAPERAPGESVGGIALDLLSQIPGAVRGALSLPQRLTNESERMRYGVGYDPAPAVEASMMTMGATPLGVARGAGEAALGAGPIRAYHGSPHDFERFDMSKIGTGEGAQAYGHGLYFAENPATAESYKIARSDPVAELSIPHQHAAEYLKVHGRDDAIKMLKENATQASDFYGNKSWGKEYQNAADILKSGWEPPKPPSPKMYEARINADPEHFLDWDKPLSEQSPHVRKALEPLRQDISREWQEANPTLGEPTHTGQIIASRGPEATEALRSAGIPGIKYLDQGSRILPQQVEHLKGQVSQLEDMLARTPRTDPKYASVESALAGRRSELAQAQSGATRNYVLFRDDIIDILRKYGLAGLSALPPAVAASVHRQMLQPVDHDPFH